MISQVNAPNSLTNHRGQVLAEYSPDYRNTILSHLFCRRSEAYFIVLVLVKSPITIDTARFQERRSSCYPGVVISLYKAVHTES